MTSMIYKNLYIVGNGFDQHHDIQCSFLNFMEWIKKNDASFFFKLAHVHNNAWEYVYEFFFSSIDMPYLEKIIWRTKPETHWVISWCSQEDRRRIMDFVIKYGILNITMINGIKTISIK